eukprot:1137065-Pelagomonas_calceolata.AAC.5
MHTCQASASWSSSSSPSSAPRPANKSCHPSHPVIQALPFSTLLRQCPQQSCQCIYMPCSTQYNTMHSTAQRSKKLLTIDPGSADECRASRLRGTSCELLPVGASGEFSSSEPPELAEISSEEPLFWAFPSSRASCVGGIRVHKTI